MTCTFRERGECVLLKEYVKKEPPYNSACSNENGSYSGESCSFMKIDHPLIISALNEYMDGSHFREMRKNGTKS